MGPGARGARVAPVHATIRPASEADALEIGAVQVRAWQAAYRGIMPDAYLDDLKPAQRAPMWRALVVEADPARRLVVATTSDADTPAGAVVGFASFGPARHDPVDGGLYALNVDPSVWGRGVGPRLLLEATTWLRGAGYPEAVLFVAVANTRARRMYEADGWTVDGTEVTEEVLGVDVREIRYRRSLD